MSEGDNHQEGKPAGDPSQEKLPVGIMFCAAALALVILLVVVGLIAFAALAPRALREPQPVLWPRGDDESVLLGRGAKRWHNGLLTGYPWRDRQGEHLGR